MDGLRDQLILINFIKLTIFLDMQHEVLLITDFTTVLNMVENGGCFCFNGKGRGECQVTVYLIFNELVVL